MAAGFRAAMEAHGLKPPTNIIPGRLHRFSTNGKRGDDAGWCRQFPDEQAGVFGDWRSGLSEAWFADDAPTQATRAEIQAAIRAMQIEREAHLATVAAETARKARELWLAGSEAKQHPYLLRKQVDLCAVVVREINARAVREILGYLPAARGEALQGRLLMLPVQRDGVVATLELIDESGRKCALRGEGTRTGAYWATGPMPEETVHLIIAEGVATTASCCLATGWFGVAALSVGNLERVALAMRERFPLADLVIAADVDKSAGLPMPQAVAAARAVGARLAWPVFAGTRLESQSDFNDWHVAEGLGAVKTALETAEVPAGGSAASGMKIAQNAGKRPESGGFSLVSAADIVPERLEWLWPGYLPQGKLTILAGRKGSGKTALSIRMAATVSTGGLWPDGSRAPRGRVIVMSQEDDLADTIVPRLRAAGADLDQVRLVKGCFDPAEGMAELEALILAAGGAALLVLDPIVTVCRGDSHKATEVRRALQPVVDLASRLRCCVLGISHFAKATQGRDPGERVIGSQAFSAVARAVLVASRGQDDRRILTRADCNLGPSGAGWGFTVEPTPVPGYPELQGVIAVRWGERLAGDAASILAECEAQCEGGTDQGASRVAETFLREELADGPLGAAGIKQRAEEAGISAATLRRARERLGVTVGKSAMAGGWIWGLPKVAAATEGAQPNTEGAHPNTEDAHQNSWTPSEVREHLRDEEEW